MGVKGRKTVKEAKCKRAIAVGRGFFSGVVAGTLVSGLCLGVASFIAGAPEVKGPETGALDVSGGSAFNQPKEDTNAVLPEANGSPEASGVSQVAAPEPDDLVSLDSDATEPSAQPQAEQTETALSEPQADASESGVDVDSESPVLPSPQTVAPQQPESEEDLSISTDPAQPLVPEAGEESAFPEEEEEPETEIATESAPEAEPETVPEEETVSNDEPASEPSSVAESDEPSSGSEPDTDTASNDQANTEPEEETTTDSQSSEVESSSVIGNLAPDVETNRLPSVGDDTTEEAVVEDTEDEQVAEDPAEDVPTPLERFAVDFENPDGKPLMSIILIDDGTSPVGLEALQNFPYPISFAMPFNMDGVEDAMAIYRAAGFEVIAMVDLPDGAGAQDTEVAMQTVLGRVPEAVAVMDGTGSGLQSSRAAAEQLAPILMESGHGAVFFPKGLNTAQQLLARQGVPAVSVFRDFDAKGQNATVIRRFLDQAAFKAGQDEAGVVMVGRLRPDTVSALLLWGLQDRADRVALAPISALLRAE